MKKIMSMLLFSAIAGTTYAQENINKLFAPKGTHRAPFRKAKEVGLASVNLRFKLASSEQTEKRGAGKAVSWAFLEGVDEKLFQEIADEYYQRLRARLAEAGYKLNNEFKESKDYQRLLDKNEGRSRQTDKKSWGIADVYTANRDAYLEYPVMMMGPHSAMGNDYQYPIGTVLITIDFAEISQSLSKSRQAFDNVVTTTSKSSLAPVIRIEGLTETGLNMRGDGSYAHFVGGNWSYCNAALAQGKYISSDRQYALRTQASKGMPESMKKFRSNTLSDLADIFGKGLFSSGRGGAGEFTYVVEADPQKYKEAVLDALDQFNEYLLAYIEANN